MTRSLSSKALLAFQIVLLLAFASLLALKAYTTLAWRMEHDTPLLYYAAFLMDKYDLVPYRDIFETSMPGTFAFHYLIGRLFGYGDAAFRSVNLALLSVLLVVAYAFMRRFGTLVAVCSAILWGLVYLSMGQQMSLQRDYIGIIPVASALLCIPARTDIHVGVPRFALVGLLFGTSILMKPHLGIFLPIVFGALLAFRRHSKRRSVLDFAKCAAVTGIALLIPASVALSWLAAHRALAPFLDIVVNYLPLHVSMTGAHEFVSRSDRVIDIVSHTSTFGGLGTVLLCSLFAYYHVVEHIDGDRAIAISLACLCLGTLAYALYPAFSGQFWPYHYMPFAYFCSISIGLCLFAWPGRLRSGSMWRTRVPLLVMALLIAVAVQLPLADYVRSLVSDLRMGPGAHAPKGGRVDEIAAWLEGRPGDSVQPLDWTGGSIHGMLLAEAKLATRFMYDYHFYHHVTSSYIQGLRQSFMEQLRAASPRFIIEVSTNKPWVWGIDTTREFPELRQFLDDYYIVAYEGDGYLIYERVSGS